MVASYADAVRMRYVTFPSEVMVGGKAGGAYHPEKKKMNAT